MLEDIIGADVIIDDILQWCSTIEEHDQRLRSFATREGVYLNLGKEIFEDRS